MKLLCGAIAFSFSTLLLAALPQYLALFTADPLSSPQFKNRCATCHVNPAGGGERNQFGQAFAAANFTITADLRAHFPEHFQYPVQTIDAHTEIHYADATGKTVVLKKDGLFTVVDPANPPAARTAAALSATPVSRSVNVANSPAAAQRSLAPQANQANARRAGGNVDWAALLPEGEGRFQTTVSCTSCHNLRYIVEERRADESGWAVTVERMIYAQGAFIPEEEIALIAHYLAEHFGPNTPRLQLPVKVNSAPAEVLRMLPGITEENAAKLLDARKQEKITDLSILESILGKETAEKNRWLISF